MRLLFVANVCGMDDSRLTIANHSGPTQKKIKKIGSMNLFFQYVERHYRDSNPGLRIQSPPY